MRDILERLYCGEIRPAETDTQNYNWKDKSLEILQFEEKVINVLNDESRVWFHRYSELLEETHADTVVESFKEGFKTAVKLILAGIAE